MLWYQCLISMNFYLPTKLQRNRRFHTTSVAVRGYRRPRVCHGWRKLCLLVLDTVSPQKNCFHLPGLISEVSIIVLKEHQVFLTPVEQILIFAMKNRIWLDSMVQFLPIWSTFLASSSMGLSWKTCSFNHLALSRFRNKMREIALSQLPKTCHFRRLFTKRGAEFAPVRAKYICWYSCTMT